MKKSAPPIKKPAEIQLGPLTIYYEAEPPLPSIKEQARLVGNFMADISTRAGGSKEDIKRWERLKKGDIQSTYVQLDEEEVVALRGQLVDESFLNKRLLSAEKQLTAAFINIRAQMWGTDHGLRLTWPEWDQYRRSLFTVEQADISVTLGKVMASRADRSAQDFASFLADKATEIPGRSYSEARALQDALLETMFVGARVAYPIHDSNPVQLPERIPAWAWDGGLSITVPKWWNLQEHQSNNSVSPFLAVNTHPTADHMRKFLTTSGSELRETRQSPTGHYKLSLMSRVEVSSSIVQAVESARSLKTEQALERITSNLLARKEEGASLLKLHLDLIDQAFKAGGPQPLLRYDLREAADRLGYRRPGSRRGFDAGTLRELYSRVLTLQSCLIQAYEVKNSKQERMAGHVPYWEIRSFEALVDGDALGPYQVLLTNKSAPVFSSLVITPGLWWAATQMSSFHLHIPSSILKLDTSGKGNEVNRMALKLAASLAVWERINATRHGGGSVEASVEQLLEKASITTADALVKQPNATRTRDQLSQAIEMLRSHGAFDITITDVDEYEAIGRGWVHRFLNTRLSLSVRVMESEKHLGKKGGRASNT